MPAEPLGGAVTLKAGGAAFFRRQSSATGEPNVADENTFAGTHVVAPGITARYRLSDRLELGVLVQDLLIGPLDGGPEHGPVVGMTVSWR